MFGASALTDKPRTYDRKVKNAQEAHEAIRPAGDSFRAPQAVAAALGRDEARLYELIWQRTVASHMRDATGVTKRVRIAGTTVTECSVAPTGTPVEFTASGTAITEPGFLRVYREDDDEGNHVRGQLSLP